MSLFLFHQNRKRVKEAIQNYFFQLTVGCGNPDCSNANCASSPHFDQSKRNLSRDQAAAQAILLAKKKAELCYQPSDKASVSSSASQLQQEQQQPTETTTTQAKQFKPEPDQTAQSSRASAFFLNDLKTDIEMSSVKHDETKKPQSDDEDFFDDDDDIVISRPTSSSVRPGSSSASLNKNSSSDMKSLNEALENALKSVSSSESKSKSNRNADLYLSETRVMTLIKKCKGKLNEARRAKSECKMDVDEKSSSAGDYSLLSNDEYLKCFRSLINAVQCVFQNYKQLGRSFAFKSAEDLAHMSASTPTVPPFSLDFNSLRRSCSHLFGNTFSSHLVEELERVIDIAVYGLCFTIRMRLKKSDVDEAELNQILHALLVVNELPIIENPQYVGQCVKAFYATVSELDSRESVKIVRLWAQWHPDELRIFLNRAQQYISVCIMKKLGNLIFVF